MLLNSKFDILHGFPKEGAIDKTFPIRLNAGVYDAIALGMVVFVNTTGAVQAATTPNRTTTNSVAVWVVIEGNSDYSGTFLQKAVCLRSNCVLRLDPANLNAGTYTPGVKLTFSAGKWQPAVATNQIIAEVIADNTAVDGTIDVYFTGGDTAAL